MTNVPNPDTILEIARLTASLGIGVGAVVLFILAWQSPKLLQVVLSFIRGVIIDWRSKPRVQKPPKTPQISKPRSG
jgi:hypothetical protein